MAGLPRLARRLQPRLADLYGLRADECLDRILSICRRYADSHNDSPRQCWSERDVVLIAYADHVRNEGEPPLATLKQFLDARDLGQAFSILHLLPFFPSTSDDGFSVVDYRQVDPAYGSWTDIESLSGDFDLMFDLVLNHTSRSSIWFKKFIKGEAPFGEFYIEANSKDDLSQVVRPRTLPLLTTFETATGTRQVWTTFSDDQVDMNFAEPNVLVEIVDVLLFFIERGARIIRLDAIAYLWKQPGTSCIHLPQTHAIVKLLRDVVEFVAPGTLLLTETNVPHAENISYWGDSDEAFLVYNLSLPPLILDAILAGDATYINRWLAQLPGPPPGTNYFNFTASHDGIGVRPLESLVPQERIEFLVDSVMASGGRVSERAEADGRATPYELNITYIDALQGNLEPGSALHVRRFMLSQALMLSLQGIPAVYFSPLFGARNDQEGLLRTGRARSINRRKFDVSELQRLFAIDSPGHFVWQAYQRLLDIRCIQKAFHPDAEQKYLPANNASIIAFVRSCPQTGRSILVAANISDRSQPLGLSSHSLIADGKDLISAKTIAASTPIAELEPYQVIWLPVKI